VIKGKKCILKHFPLLSVPKYTGTSRVQIRKTSNLPFIGITYFSPVGRTATQFPESMCVSELSAIN